MELVAREQVFFVEKSRVQAGEGVDNEVTGAFMWREGRQVTGGDRGEKILFRHRRFSTIFSYLNVIYIQINPKCLKRSEKIKVFFSQLFCFKST